MASAITEARNQLCELSEEIREAFDGTPEQFKDTTGRPREDAADELEATFGFLEDVPKDYRDDVVTWVEMRKGKDGKLLRPARRDNVVRCLQSCVAYGRYGIVSGAILTKTPPQDAR